MANVIGDIDATTLDSDWQTAGMEAFGGNVRQASPQDAAGCIAVYRPYVEDTAISWETEVQFLYDDLDLSFIGVLGQQGFLDRWVAQERGDAPGSRFSTLE